MASAFLGRAAALCLAVVLLSGCEALLFFPQHQLLRTPEDVGLAYQDVRIPVGNTVLHGWWLPAEQPHATLLFSHGNAENISTHLASVYWLPKEGVNVLLIDYRGFGKSEGVPSVAAAVEDVRASWQWLLAEQGDWPLFGLGQSLGASLMAAATAREAEALTGHIAGLVLDAGFTRYSAVAREQAAKSPLTWLLQWPVGWAMPSGFDPIDALSSLPPAPVLIIHGRRDPVIALHHAQQLHEQAKSPKSLYVYDGGHIESFHRAATRQRLLDFIDESVGR